jgi:hypothetical protein
METDFNDGFKLCYLNRTCKIFEHIDANIWIELASRICEAYFHTRSQAMESISEN